VYNQFFGTAYLGSRPASVPAVVTPQPAPTPTPAVVTPQPAPPPPAPTVTGVTVTPFTVTVNQGATQQFTAIVTGTNNPPQTVTWTVTGATAGTSISPNGLLTVSASQTPGALTVRAASTVDTTRNATTAVIVPAPTPAPAPVVTPQPAPTPAAAQTAPGLYANGVFQGAMDLLDAIDQIKINARSGSNYVIVLGKSERVPYINLDFNNMRVNVTLKGPGIECTVSYESNRPTASLFRVGPGATFTLEDGVALVGLPSDSRSLVLVEGGTFIMNGGTIRNNRLPLMVNGIPSSGGGVRMQSGSFTMNGGTISGNTADSGGGVAVNQGTFTMNGGVISGNTAATYIGGGVNISAGTFIKSGTGGVIYGNNAPDGQANKASRGAAVTAGYFDRNTTARISQAMDSRQGGAAGGWE